MTAKRYKPRKRILFPSTSIRNNSVTGGDDNGPLTLIFAHGAGFHKEQFEPTIEDLWGLIVKGSSGSKSGDSSNVREVREFWSVDCPNHGDAAILNEHIVMHGYDSFCELMRSLFFRGFRGD